MEDAFCKHLHQPRRQPPPRGQVRSGPGPRTAGEAGAPPADNTRSPAIRVGSESPAGSLARDLSGREARSRPEEQPQQEQERPRYRGWEARAGPRSPPPPPPAGVPRLERGGAGPGRGGREAGGQEKGEERTGEGALPARPDRTGRPRGRRVGR